MTECAFLDCSTCKNWPVTLIGAGGIGGLTAITLAKMGVPEMIIWDGDVVAIENTGTQFFSSSDVERLKVDAHQAIT